MKRLLAIMLTLAMVLTLCACGSSEPATSETETSTEESTGEHAPDTVYNLKIAHVNSPIHPARQALLKFKELVESQTNGGVEVDIYDSSVLGGELEEI